MVEGERLFVNKEIKLLLTGIILLAILSITVFVNAESIDNNSLLYPAQLIYSQNSPKYLQKNRDGSYIGFGYVNSNGTWIIDPIYEDVGNIGEPYECTSNGYLYPAQLNGLYGYFNSRGDWIIPPQFENAKLFHSNLAFVSENGKSGFINPSGQYVFTLNQYEMVGDFFDGLAWKTTSTPQEENMFYGYIDKENHWVIPPKYPFRLGTMANRNFSCGYAVLQNTDGTYDYIDRNDKRLTNLSFEYASPFSEGYASVKLNNQWGFIDTNGKWVIYPQFSYAWSFSEGLAAVLQDDIGVFIDHNGNGIFTFEYAKDLFIRSSYDNILFHEGLAGLGNAGKRRYMNKRGQWVIRPEFSYVGPFNNGIAFVQKDGGSTFSSGTLGYIDQQGNWIINWTA